MQVVRQFERGNPMRDSAYLFERNKMKPKSIFALVLAGMFFLPMAAGAWILVPSYEDTGWQTYSRLFADGFAGTVGFVVSDQGDSYVASYLFLDNFSHALSNPGFESGDYSGFDLFGGGEAVMTAYIGADTWQIYQPTEGDYMSVQVSDDTTEVDTSSFLNHYGNPGTNGSVLQTSINIAQGEIFSFDWAFATEDYSPYADFSLVYFRDNTGAIVFTDGLGQLRNNVVPEPATILLFGSGLAGLAGLRRKIKT